MPIGVITNVLAVIIGGIIGTAVGPRISERFKNGLNTIFGICAMTMGVSSIALMENMPAVILAVIVGTCLGFLIHLGDRITAGAMYMQRGISRIFGEKLMSGSGLSREEYEMTLATGFRMIKVKEFPIADMIPAMLLVMPISHLWVTYVLPLVVG